MKIIKKIILFVTLIKYINSFGTSPIEKLFLDKCNNWDLSYECYLGDPEIDKLNKKIEQLNLGAFDPFKFELVKAEVEGSFSAKKITKTVKESLFSDINTILASRIYIECDKFLSKTSGNCTKELSWLSLLENKIGKNQKLTNYRLKLKDQLKQIELYIYYTNTLPKEIRKWINSGEVNFETNTYSKYTNQLSDMPANFKYKNEKKLNTIHNELRNELDLFSSRWQSTTN